MRILVTGGSSPLGDVLLPLLTMEHHVVAVARSDAAALRLQAHGVEILRHDLSSPTALPRLRITSVVHAAGISLAGSVGPLLTSLSPQHLIVISSASATVEGHPRRESVLGGERLLEGVAPVVTVIRPTMIYGSPRDRNIRRLWSRLRNLPLLPRVQGGGLLQPVFADDLAAAVSELLHRPRSGVLPVGGPVPLRFDDLLEALACAMGKRRGGPAIPVENIARLLRVLPLPSGTAAAAHALQMLLIDRTVAPPSACGFAFRPTPFEAGLRLAVERYQRTRESSG